MYPVFDIFSDQQSSPSNFSAIRISLANPELIRKPAQEGGWSWGEVTKPETINYRSFKPEKDGIFCAQIFGPVKDYECLCKRYRGNKHAGQTCERCKVEVTSSKVRRQRMGHIDLAAPVAHIWFLKSLPSRIGSLLDITLKEVDLVLYCEARIITHVKDHLLEEFHKALPEDEFNRIYEYYYKQVGDATADDNKYVTIPKVGQILTEADYDRIHMQYNKVSMVYTSYLFDNFGLIRRALEIAESELNQLGASQETLPLRVLMESEGRFYSRTVGDRQSLRSWMESIQEETADERFRDRGTVLTWELDPTQVDAEGNAVYHFEPVAGDDIKTLDRHLDELKALFALHSKEGGAPVTQDGFSLLPLSYHSDEEGVTSGLAVFVQGFKKATSRDKGLEELTALFRSALTHLYGEDLEDALSSRVESALHLRLTVKYRESAAKDLNELLVTQAGATKDIRESVAKFCRKFMPLNSVSVVARRKVSDESGERDVYHTVAGDHVSAADHEQERIRALVTEAEKGFGLGEEEVNALIIPINEHWVGEHDETYFLYLQGLKVNTKDTNVLRELFAYTINELTRDVVVSLNDGEIEFSDVEAIEIHEPPVTHRVFNEATNAFELHAESNLFAPTGERLVTSHNAKVKVSTPDGVSEERYTLKYGDRLCAADKSEIRHSEPITMWDWPPFQKPILSTKGGYVVYKNMTDDDRTLDGTGKGARVASIRKGKGQRKSDVPKIEVYEVDFKPSGDGFIASPKGKPVEIIELPKGAILNIDDGDLIACGQAVALVESAQSSGKNVERKVGDQLSAKLEDQLSRFPSFTASLKLSKGTLKGDVQTSNDAFTQAFGFSINDGKAISAESFLGEDAYVTCQEALSMSSRHAFLIQDWSKGAQYLRSNQHINLLALARRSEDGKSTLVEFFVLESQGVNAALVTMVNRLNSTIEHMLERFEETEWEFIDDQKELDELFIDLFEPLDEVALMQANRLIERGLVSASWLEPIQTLLKAAGFSHYLREKDDPDQIFFTANMGAEAIRERLRTLDLYSLYEDLKARIPSQAISILSEAFGDNVAYFFDEVDHAGFDLFEAELPEGMSRPERGEIWSESDYISLCAALKKVEVPVEHRPLFRALPTASREGDEERYILQNLSESLCNTFKVTLGQIISKDQYADISKRAFIDGESDHYIIKELPRNIALADDLQEFDRISYSRYIELKEECELLNRTFVAQPLFEAEPISEGYARFNQLLDSLSLPGFDRLSHSIRHSQEVSSDLALRKKADLLVNMLRWLKTLDKLKAFDAHSYDTTIRSQDELLDDLRCSYFDRDDARELLPQHMQSREWFLLSVISEYLRLEMTNASDSRKKKFIKRLKVVDAIRNSETLSGDLTSPEALREWMGNKPEWMILEAIPVLPPDLRPLVPLDGGRFATSDLNDLYRRVITRNNRLRRLTEELFSPQIIQNNEKRMVQEAVDALFDNARRQKPIAGANKRPLKSLSAMIKGKQGRFRQNLLGKRVDYSGRSVIVVGPELRLHQCGLPKKMALELFKPFIINKLQKVYGHAKNMKAAKKMIDEKQDVVWDILDEVIQEHPVMLNRAPTLHRLGIQAFEPKLIEGKAIQLHPLVCSAFNADFDGDQMAVHLPLSVEAQIETRVLMMSTNNILSPANGKPIIVPSQDIVLGCYYMTRERPFAKGEGRLFTSSSEARAALAAGAVHMQAKVRCRVEGEIVETTVGRLVMSEILPPELEFALVNRPMGKKELAQLVDIAYRRCTAKQTVLLADAIKDLGYAQATRAGLSIALADLNVSDKKREIVKKGYEMVAEFQVQASEGTISQKERYNKVVDHWTKLTKDVAEAMLDGISKETFTSESGETVTGPSFNSVFIMADSGARGGPAQIRQLAGMRGLMAKPSGEIIETPITANFREGLSVLEYFISAHGARKGLADTALKTANSGYLTRRLVDVAQDAIITEYACSAQNPMELRALVDGNEVKEKLSDLALGRVLGENVYHDGEILLTANTLIDEEEMKILDDHDVSSIYIRTPLTCETRRGVCALCYGGDLARGRLVNLGEAVGVMAAQSIGEPGTQLTMRTFHIGGAASQQARKSSIASRTEGKIRLEGVKLIQPTVPPAVARQGSQVVVTWDKSEVPHFTKQPYELVINRTGHLYIDDHNGNEKENHSLNEGYMLDLKDGATVHAGQRVVHWDPFSTVIFSEVEGVAVFRNISVDEGTLREEKEGSGSVVRRIAAPARGSRAGAKSATKSATRKRNSKKLVDRATTHAPRIDICEARFIEVDGAWVVTPGEVLTVKASDGTERKASYDLPVDAKLEVINGGLVGAGQVIAKSDIEAAKTKDITGGLPRVAELFEARAKEKSAVLAKIDGRVESIEGESPKRVVTIVSDDPAERDHKEKHLIKGQQVVVRVGEMVRAGDPLSDGPMSPHEILSVKSEMAVAEFLVNEIQQVYRLQGVKISDKHIEVIVRQMLRRVRIKDVGDSNFLPDEQVEKWMLDEENARLAALEDGQRLAIAEPLLLGISKASLATDSFISAASFQETTKVLTAAALKGKVDYLNGLKENVIMGRLIPAGTGLKGYRSLHHELASDEKA